MLSFSASIIIVIDSKFTSIENMNMVKCSTVTDYQASFQLQNHVIETKHVFIYWKCWLGENTEDEIKPWREVDEEDVSSSQESWGVESRSQTATLGANSESHRASSEDDS